MLTINQSCFVTYQSISQVIPCNDPLYCLYCRGHSKKKKSKKLTLFVVFLISRPYLAINCWQKAQWKNLIIRQNVYDNSVFVPLIHFYLTLLYSSTFSPFRFALCAQLLFFNHRWCFAISDLCSTNEIGDDDAERNNGQNSKVAQRSIVYHSYGRTMEQYQ